MKTKKLWLYLNWKKNHFLLEYSLNFHSNNEKMVTTNYKSLGFISFSVVFFSSMFKHHHITQKIEIFLHITYTPFRSNLETVVSIMEYFVEDFSVSLRSNATWFIICFPIFWVTAPFFLRHSFFFPLFHFVLSTEIPNFFFFLFEFINGVLWCLNVPLLNR